MELIEKFKNLLVMAAADGVLSNREIEFLSDRSKKWQIDETQFAAAIEYAMSDQATITVTADPGERIETLKDLIRMMGADGELADIEMQLFAAAAARLEISDKQLNEMIDSLL